MHRMLWLILLALSFGVQAQESPIGFEPTPDPPPLRDLDAIVRKGKVWSTTPAEAEKAWADYGFTWTDDHRTSARSVYPSLVFRDCPVVEALAYFEDGHCSSFTYNIYTRGDIGDVQAEPFRKVLGIVEEAVTGFMKTKPRDLKNFGTEGIDKEAKVWAQAHLAVQLEWSITDEGGRGERPQFMRLRVFPAENGTVSLVQRGPERVRMTALRQNLVKAENGDVYVGNVPMVDQGDKGYCASAVTERILRYYGRNVDQHEIAQISQSGSNGTTQELLVQGIKENASKLGLKIQQLDALDEREYKAMVRAYNRIAKAKDIPQLSDSTIRSGYAMIQMNVPEMIEARASTTNYKKFHKEVLENIKRGVPITWIVMLGRIREDPPVGSGGHMRLIIGYNEETDALLYTDTWGQGHELKRLPMPDAYCMTLAYLLMLPK